MSSFWNSNPFLYWNTILNPYALDSPAQKQWNPTNVWTKKRHRHGENNVKSESQATQKEW